VATASMHHFVQLNSDRNENRENARSSCVTVFTIHTSNGSCYCQDALSVFAYTEQIKIPRTVSHHLFPAFRKCVSQFTSDEVAGILIRSLLVSALVGNLAAYSINPPNACRHAVRPSIDPTLSR